MFKILQKFSYATTISPKPQSQFLIPSHNLIRNFHTSIAPLAKRQIGMKIDESNSEDGLHYDADRGLYRVKGTAIPNELSHFFTDPEGKKSRRDALLKKKVRRLRRTAEEKRQKKSKGLSFEEKDYEPFSIRQKRVAELVKDAILETVSKESFGNFPYVKSNCSFEDIEMTRDLRRATVYYGVVDPSLEEATAQELQSEAFNKVFRLAVTRRISHLKFSPQYVFVNEASRVKPVLYERLAALEDPATVDRAADAAVRAVEEQEILEDPNHPYMVEENLLFDMRMALREYQRYVEENHVDGGKAYIKDLHNTMEQEIQTQKEKEGYDTETNKKAKPTISKRIRIEPEDSGN